MKAVAVFIIAIALASSMRVKSSAQLSFENKLQSLKKTGWGKIAVGLMELQVQTGGPMQELITAFQNLIKDLNFKMGSTHEEYVWMKAEHFELDKEINFRLRDAKVRFGVSSAHLQNTLYPARAELEHLIAVDEQLIADTHHAIEVATAEREASHATYQNNVVEHHLALEAVDECQALVRSLQQGGSLIQVRKTQKTLKDLHGKMKGMNGFTHLAKALLAVAQEFADSSATAAVLDLLQELEDNLTASEADLHAVEAAEVAAFEAFLEVSWNTIHEAEARVEANEAALEVVNAEIARQEDIRDTAEADRDQAQADLDFETARWEAYVAAYEDLVAELTAELDAVDRCIEVFATANLDSDMMDVVNQ